MVNSDQDNLVAAIAVLSTAVTKIGERLTAQEERLDEARTARAQYLTATTYSLLPKFSSGVLRNLRQYAASFVTPAIETVFEDNATVFLVFRPRGADAALVMVQSQLSSYLDQQQYGKLKDMDERINSMVERVKVLTDRRQETQDLLAALKKAYNGNVRVSADLSGKLEQIVRKAQGGGAARRSPMPLSRSHSTTVVVEADDDFDIWFYLITDIPTSMRTLLIDAVFDHHHSGQGACAVSGPDVDTTSVTESGSVDSGVASTVLDPGFVAEAGVAVAAGAAAAILTDDTLGAFS